MAYKLLFIYRVMVGSEEKIKIFKKYLDEELFVCENTKRTYTQAVRSFYQEHNLLTQKTVVHFLKTHRRFYYLFALKHLCRSLDMDEKKINFPKGHQIEKTRKIRGEIEWSHLNNINNKLIPLAEKKGFGDIKHILRILYYTGCRIREVLELKRKEIYKKDDEKYYIRLYTKGENMRECPIPNNYAEDLLKFIIEEKGVLPNQYCFYSDYTKKMINDYELKNIKGKLVVNEKGLLRLRMAKYTKFKRQIEECDEGLFNEIKKTHIFRRGIINELQKRGVDIYSIASFMGHIDIETTRRYFDEKTKKRAIQKCFNILVKEDEKNKEDEK